MNPYIEIFLTSEGDVCDTAVCVRHIIGKELKFNRNNRTWMLGDIEYKSMDIINKIKNDVCNVIVQNITIQKNGLSKREFEQHAEYFENRLNTAFKLSNREFVDRVIYKLKKLCE